jgi:hypothetical protein
MEAKVTLTLTVGELDTLRYALDEYVEVQEAVAKNGSTEPALRRKAREASAKAAVLQGKLLA